MLERPPQSPTVTEMAASETPGPGLDRHGDQVTCGHCRLSFPRHPSMLGDLPTWWLCQSCRNRLLGNDAPTGSRRSWRSYE